MNKQSRNWEKTANFSSVFKIMPARPRNNRDTGCEQGSFFIVLTSNIVIFSVLIDIYDLFYHFDT